MRKVLVAASAALLVSVASTGAMANDFEAELSALAAGKIREISQSAELVAAIKAQNEKNASLGQADIDKLDKQWRAEVDAGSKPMIDGVMGNELSKFLAQKKEASGGLITEAFVMDDKGLNVGQSDVTSDYWQGDEDKFRKSFGAGHGALFIDPPERDESTQILQCQASMTVVDETGRPIGAITVGVNLDQL